MDDEATGRAGIEADGERAVAGAMAGTGAQDLPDTSHLAAEIASHGAEVGHSAPPISMDASSVSR